jgi:hypothetical protein
MNYFSLVLRFWEESNPPWMQSGEWRFSIDNPRTGNRKAFDSIEALSSFIHSELKGGDFFYEKDKNHLDL